MPLHLPKVRGDLEYFEREMEGEDVIVVRDPIRGTYFKYNQLQAAMLRSLDGVRSIEQMVAKLSEEFEVEIPLIAAERFVIHARKQMLLDIGCYGVPEAKAQKKVLQALEKQGFRFRDLQSTNHSLKQRVVSGEAVLFMGGIRHLQSGQPAKALDYFCAVLELNPKNERARTLVETIQTAYVKALSGTSSDWPTVLVFDPTRILAVLDRTVGRIVFHRFAWVGLVALISFAVYCYSITTYPDLRFDGRDIAGAVVLYILHGYCHELGHALACYHYGGRVTEIGFTAMYYVSLNPYCDTSSSYLFKDRRSKIAVQLGGTMVTLVSTCLLFIFLAVLHPSVFMYTSAQLIMWLMVVVLFFNLIPFMKFDGYYALCDYVGVPNLRERSSRIMKSWLGARLLGLPRDEEPLSAKKRRMFIVFAALSLAFTLFWMYNALFRLLAPTVERFRGVGLAVAIAILAYLLRSWLVLPIVRLGRLLVTERKQIFTVRRSVTMAALMTAVIVPWTIPTAVRIDAEFALAPKQRALVRALTPGFVERVLVREGETVRRGQPLAILRNIDLDAQLQVAEAELAKVDARLARLEHGARPEELALANRQLAMARAAQDRTTARSTTATKLASGGMGPAAAATSAVGAAVVDQSMTSAAQWKLAGLQAGSRAEEIAAATAERARVAGQLDHARADHELLTLRSPIDGVVATKHLEEQIYVQLARGGAFAEVVDTSELIAEIRLPSNAPLDELSVGDKIVLQPFGTPGDTIECTVARIRDVTETQPGAKSSENGTLLVMSSPFRSTKAIVGMAGHARLYGNLRTLAYAHFYLPLQRVFRIKLQM